MKTISEIINIFGAKECPNGGWIAKCPAHDDNNPSLSIAKGNDNHILLKCHAGCKTEDVLAAKGLTWKDIMPERVGNSNHSKVVAEYIYTDENGKPVYKVVRKEPKAFAQAQITPEGEDVWNMKGVHRYPYYLPELINAAKRGETVFVVEGEKDVETLRAHGFIATCNAGGAGKWNKEWATYFDNSSLVIIIADNDSCEKGFPGQKHAIQVRNSLKERNIPTKICVLPNDKDVSDFFARGGTLEEFNDYIANPNPWPSAWEFDSPCQVASSNRFGEMCAEDREKKFPRYHKTLNLEYGGSVTIEACAENDSLIEAISKAKSTACMDSFKNNPAKNSSMTKRDFQDLTDTVIVLWLRSRGRFFYNLNTTRISDTMFCDNKTNKLSYVRSDGFKTTISNNANLNREDKAFKRIIALIEDAAMEPSISTGIIPSAFTERKGNAIYISCGPSKIVRAKDGKVETVDNGTDGVVFDENVVYKEWKLLPDNANADNPFTKLRIFKNASFPNSYGRDLLESWYLNTFAHHDTHAPLLITGEFRSGKTRMAKGLMEMLGCRIRIDDIDPKKEDDFWVKINTPGMVCFDNLEEDILSAKWFPSSIERAATDGSKDTRKLYTHKVFTYTAHADMILTSKDPRFAENSGLSDRLIIVNLDQERSTSEDKELSLDIESHRDEALTWTARTLAKALQDDAPIEEGINKRHPDFGTFALRCGRASGKYEAVCTALRSGEFSKSHIVLLHNTTAHTILEFLRTRNGEWAGTGSEMASAVMNGTTAGETDEDKTRTENECQKLSTLIGKTLAAFRENFSVCFPGYYSTKSHGKTTYHFVGMNEFLRPTSTPGSSV